MNSKIVNLLSKNLKKDLPNIKIGSTVSVTVRVKEGTKERNQKYEGVIIQIKGSGINKTFTVRRVFQGVGVERVFFLHSPKLEKIEILKQGKTRRAKLYYLRERAAKVSRLKEEYSSLKETEELPKEEIPEEGKLVEVNG